MILEHIHWDYIKAVKGLITVLRDPDKTDSVFEITEGLHNTNAFQRMLSHARSNPECAQLIDQRYRGPGIDLDELMKLPEGSLGRVFAARMRAQRLEVVFYPSIEIKDDASYLAMRLRQTHDVWHTLTGFDIDPAGELGLQGFMLAQLSSPLAVALIGGGLLRSLVGGALPKYDLSLTEMMDKVMYGWQLGRAAGPLLAQKWEEGWARPLTDWQRALHLPATA